MPVTFTGPRCYACPERRPVWDVESGLCAPCYLLQRACGRDPAALSIDAEFARLLYEAEKRKPS